MKMSLAGLYILIAICLSSPIAHAGALTRVGGEGTVDIGIGPPLYGNPFPHHLAGKVMDPERCEFGTEFMVPKFTYEVGGKKWTSKNMVHALPILSLSKRLNDDLVVGVDVNTDFGIGASFEYIAFGQDTQTLVAGTYIKPYAAFQVTDRLSVGVSLYALWCQLHWDAPFDIGRNYLPIKTETSAMGYGGGYAVGAMYQFDRLFLSLNYTSSAKADLDGRTNILFGPLVIRDSIDSQFQFPNRVDFAAGYHFSEKLFVAADISWFGYSKSSLDEVAINFHRLGFSKAVDLNWRDHIVTHVGVGYQLTPNLEIGGGVGYMTKSIPDKTADFLTPDIEGYSAGVRVKYEKRNWSVSGSVTKAWGENEARGAKLGVDVTTLAFGGTIKF